MPLGSKNTQQNYICKAGLGSATAYDMKCSFVAAHVEDGLEHFQTVMLQNGIK